MATSPELRSELRNRRTVCAPEVDLWQPCLPAASRDALVRCRSVVATGRNARVIDVPEIRDAHDGIQSIDQGIGQGIGQSIGQGPSQARVDRLGAIVMVVELKTTDSSRPTKGGQCPRT